MNVIRINSENGAEYDIYLVPPPEMTLEDAVDFIDKSIRDIKVRHEDEALIFEDLQEPLTLAGFTSPNIVDCEEVW